MKENNDFRNGFIVGIVVSLLMVAFYQTASGDDRFMVLDYGPIIEGTPNK